MPSGTCRWSGYTKPVVRQVRSTLVQADREIGRQTNGLDTGDEGSKELDHFRLSLPGKISSGDKRNDMKKYKGLVDYVLKVTAPVVKQVMGKRYSPDKDNTVVLIARPGAPDGRDDKWRDLRVHDWVQSATLACAPWNHPVAITPGGHKRYSMMSPWKALRT